LKEGVWVKKSNWLSYFAYLVVLLCYIIFSNKILIYVSKQREMTYKFLPLMLWSTVISIVLGLLIGFEQLLLQKRKEGSWRIDLPKIVLLGIPSLYFSFGIFIYYCPITFVQQYLTYPIQFLVESNSNLLSIIQVLLGYIITTSFIKVED
jgi:nitrogen fixation/metabolism regulation signal transduction histidine kinase